MIDVQQAKLSPRTVFDAPHEVVQSKELTRDDKIEILKQWRYDALLQETAQSENLQSDKDTKLRAVLAALQELGYTPSEDELSGPA
jgi:hypothetical protein